MTISQTISLKSRARNLSKRILQLETLENRELLSINPLGATLDFTTDYIQKSQSIATEAEENGGEEQTPVGTELPFTYGVGSANNVTTNSVKLEWNKPAAIYKVNGNYKIYVSDKPMTVESLATADCYESKTNALVLTNLAINQTYYYYIEVNVTHKTYGIGDEAVAKGSFKTRDVPENAMGELPVGPPTDVKASYVAPKSGSPATVKVTWKAPQGFTGAYEIQFTNPDLIHGDDSVPTAYGFVAAGGKLEFSIAITAQGTESTLQADQWYHVTVVAKENRADDEDTGRTLAASTLTSVYTNTKAPTADTTVTTTRTMATPKKSATPVTENTGYSATVNWEQGDENDQCYLVVIKDANKAILFRDFVYDTNVMIDNHALFNGVLGGQLTPKAKYTVEVYNYNEELETYSSPLTISFTAADFPAPTVKVVGKPGLTDATITITPAKTATLINVAYYVQITSAIDSKGKADWDGGAYELIYPEGLNNNVSFYEPEQLQNISLADLELATYLIANTTYYVRIVAAHLEPAEWEAMPLFAASKEVKFKTAAVPLATIGKMGFDLNYNWEMGLNFSFKSPGMNDKGGVLTDSNDRQSDFRYVIYVAPDTAKVGTDGLLIGAKAIVDEISLEEHYADDGETLIDYRFPDGDVLTFSTIANLLGDIREMKGIQIQVQVTYSNYDHPNHEYYAQTYTKPAKLTLQKWFA